MEDVRSKVYANASPLIALARIGRLDLLTLLPTPVYVTATVWQEVAGGAGRPGADALREARRDGLLVVVPEGDPSDYPQLEAGEAATLSAALAARGVVVIDDQKARRLLITNAGLAVGVPGHISTVGLLLLAKRRGRIGTVRPLLDQLRRESFRMSTGLYERALRYAGEWQ
jgi:predicted nucleic acid-binding protein